MNRTIETHPLYTIFPAHHSPLLQPIIHPLRGFLTKILDFLEEKSAFATLICDQHTLKIISDLISYDELVDYRVLTVDIITKNRQRQIETFAIYFLIPTPENVNLIAQDFGGAPILSLTEVIKIRQQEKCCVRNNKQFNPYSYRGSFIAFTSDYEHISQQIKKVNLQEISSRPEILSIDFTVRNRYINLNIKSKLSQIDEGQVKNKLENLFCNLKIKPSVFTQKGSQLAGLVSKLEFQDFDESAKLIVLDRKCDILSMLFFSNEFTSIFTDLSHKSPNIEIQYEKQSEMIRETVEVDQKALQFISRYNIIQGVNSVFQTFNDFNGLKKGQLEFSNTAQKINLQKLTNHENLLLQPLILQRTNQIWNLFKVAKYVDNKSQLISNIQSFQNSLFSTLLQNNFKLFLELPISQTETRKTLSFLFSLSTRPDFDVIDSARLFLAVIVFSLITKGKDEIKFQQQMLQNEFYENKLPLDEQYRCIGQKFIEYFDIQYADTLKIYDNTSTQFQPFVLNLIQSIVSSQKLSFLNPQFKFPFKPQLTKSSWTLQDELVSSKANIYCEKCAAIEDFDAKQFRTKEKIFIYISQGITEFEICSVEKYLEEKYGKVSIFNKGIEDEYDFEVYLISDQIISGRELIYELCE
ncbi:Sec1 family protein [Spironucleus salmonicida]|uniref:Sec1 family protein n=1 Tax=Spironucleus salmonicida TaxID=348837 RepID=V6LDF2_9EUKA|nr:Sec1 family protein [Spironucleus salmonicida]|eukprot:EST42540.1 Sec1 family protein [Spironucleus salmonicida]